MKRIGFVLLIIFSIQASAQDRVKISGSVYAVKIVDYFDGKINVKHDDDSTGKIKKIPTENIEAWYCSNGAVVENIRSFNKKFHSKLVEASVANSWEVTTSSPADVQKVKPVFESTLLGILPMKNGAVEYEKVFLIPGVDKNELFHRAMIWLAKVYRSAPDVIKYSSESKGQIIGKGNIRATLSLGIFGSLDSRVDHAIEIKIKDGKALLNISDFVCNGYLAGSQYSSGGPWSNNLEPWALQKNNNRMKDYLRAIDSDMKDSFSSFEKYLNTDPSDW